MSKACLFGLVLALAAGAVQAEEGERIKRYLAYPNGTALDTETGLLWMRCLVGQTWTGSTCSGEGEEFKWEEAKQQTADFAGHSDWRIPTIKELRILVYCSTGKPEFFRTDADPSGCEGNCERPTIVQAVFPNTPSSGVWSGSPDTHNSNYAWDVGFGYGSVGYDAKYNRGHVRLVRDGQ